jgi:hypothetical protein
LNQFTLLFLDYNSRPNTGGQAIDLVNIEDDMEDLSLSGTLGSAGALGAPNASRARMLAQQREIQLKKRQAATQQGGINI